MTDTKLTNDQIEHYDPQAHGWEAARTFTSDIFPEVGINRRMVWKRDFWRRGDERLVVEFTSPWVLHAVARDGEWLPEATWDTLLGAMSATGTERA